MWEMPIYEFHCPVCNHQFSELVQVGKIAPCPACGEEKPSRRLSKFVTLRNRPPSAVDAPAVPSATSSHANTFRNCTIKNCHTGVKIGPGAHMISHDLRVEDTQIAVDNEGVFEDTGTVIRNSDGEL